MSSYSSSKMPPYNMAYPRGSAVRGTPNIQQQEPQSNLPEPSFVNLLTGEGGSDQFDGSWQIPLDFDLAFTQSIEQANYGPPPENTLDDLIHIGRDLARRLANALKNKQASEQTKLAQETEQRANEYARLQTKQIEGPEYNQAKDNYKRLVNKEIGNLLEPTPPKPLKSPVDSAPKVPQFPDMFSGPWDTFSLDFSVTDPGGSTEFSAPFNSNFLLQQSLPGIDTTPDTTANLRTWHAGQRKDGPFPARLQAAQLDSPTYNLGGFTSQQPTESVTSARSGQTDARLRTFQDMQLNSPASQQAQTPSDKGSAKRPYSGSHSLARKPSGATDKLKPSDLTGVAKFAKDKKELAEEYFLMKMLRTLAVQQELEDRLTAEFKDELDLENESIFSAIDQQHVAEVNRLLEPPEDAVFSIKTFLKSVKKKIALALSSNTNKKQRIVADSEFNA